MFSNTTLPQPHHAYMRKASIAFTNGNCVAIYSTPSLFEFNQLSWKMSIFRDNVISPAGIFSLIHLLDFHGVVALPLIIIPAKRKGNIKYEKALYGHPLIRETKKRR
jgi:hypothetical protein